MKKSKNILISLIVVLVLTGFSFVYAQEEEPVISPATEAAEGLDLQAVCELFKGSENLSEFEQDLNNPEIGVNNLDLDGNGEIDFIRVIEEVEDDTHIVVLQVPIAEDEYQDVAYIEIEKTGEEEYNVQAHGNEVIYGPNYYVYPPTVTIRTWPILPRLFYPGYRPYQSVYRFGFYPRWWKPRPIVKVNIYHTRVFKIRGRAPYRIAHRSRVTTLHRIKYKPRTSPRVKKHVVKKPRRKKVVRKSKIR
jgi:hypothetical protein